jgi:hypothetical protein
VPPVPISSGYWNFPPFFSLASAESNSAFVQGLSMVGTRMSYSFSTDLRAKKVRETS